MDTNEYFGRYQEFVEGVTSEDSKDTDSFLKKIDELEEAGINFAAFDTAVSGIAGEAGEISDLWKKLKFHSKPWNAENKEKMISECGDMFWYLSKLMLELDITLTDVLEYNIKKLESRYPGGTFSVERSENRNNELI